MKLHTFTVISALILVAAPLFAAQPDPDIRIPFANYGGIRNWSADGDSGLYIQGRNNRWYRATLFGPCIDLPFAEHVGFVVEPSGEFDRFSAILVRGHQCMLRSLTESAGPPPKAKAKGP